MKSAVPRDGSYLDRMPRPLTTHIAGLSIHVQVACVWNARVSTFLCPVQNVTMTPAAPTTEAGGTSVPIVWWSSGTASSNTVSCTVTNQAAPSRSEVYSPVWIRSGCPGITVEKTWGGTHKLLKVYIPQQSLCSPVCVCDQLSYMLELSHTLSLIFVHS